MGESKRRGELGLPQKGKPVELLFPVLHKKYTK